MPTFHFTETEASRIAAYFAAVDKVTYPVADTAISTTPELLKAGAELFTKSQCASCHPTSNVMPANKEPADLAPNLLLANERLRPEWVLLWLRDPQKIFPGTRMPTFFSEYPKSPYPDILGGD